MRRTILVVEDDEQSRRVLLTALERAGYEVATVPSGLDIDSTVADSRPDLALVDLNLGDGPDGFEVARRIRRDSDAAVIFLSAAGGLDDRLNGFEVGGDDYVVKPVSVAELLARIDAVLRRSKHEETGRLCVGDIALVEQTQAVTRGDHPVALTNLEFSLLRVLLRNRNRVMSKRDLLAQVWGFEEFDVNLVEVYISSLRKKLEAHGPRVIHTVRGSGYVLRG